MDIDRFQTFLDVVEPERGATVLSADPIVRYYALIPPFLFAGFLIAAIRHQPRSPIGFSGPTVVSIAVWCSISALISAPISTTITENQIQVMKATTAPSDP